MNQRSEHQGAIDRNNSRVNSDPDYYRNRQQIIEHQFGTLKRQWGFAHVLMKGKENVLGEVSILFTAYNLKRSLSIFGFEGLLERLKTLLSNISGNLELTCSKRSLKKVIEKWIHQVVRILIGVNGNMVIIK